MSEPASAVPKRMMTRPKNATQHPGHILTEAEGYTKRHTKAQKAADDKCEKEEKQASEMATQEGHKRVAAFQKKMQTDQAAIRADAPKPTRPRPRPVKKAVKPVETSNSTVAEDKAVGAKGKGGRAGDKSAAGANVEHPESDAEDEEQEVRVPGAQQKEGEEDGVTSEDATGPTKFGVAAGRISHWRSSITAKPSSNTALPRRTDDHPPCLLSSLVLLPPLNSLGGVLMADRFVTLFADDDLDESVERSQALARMSKQKGASSGDDFVDDHASMIEEDSLSSEVEFMSHIKPIVKIESEPVSLRVTSTVTNIGVKHKAPMTKRTKSSCQRILIVFPASQVLVLVPLLGPAEVEILPRSAYRIKNLPGGSRAVARTPGMQFTGDIPHTVTTDGPVMALDDIETDDDRKDFAKNLRLKLGFLYGTITEDGKYKQPFQSELLVQVLVQHRWNAPLNIISGDTLWKAVKVPHSLNKVTGKPSSALKAFSDTNYGEANQRLHEVHQPAPRRRGAPIILDEDSDDERALIYDELVVLFYYSPTILQLTASPWPTTTRGAA
ncbi:hypothetical protein F4604DRAFT_1675749 [Suillus subluteus]|nr:hypothetical protein F4604DRAFT_1675749 [Suillus subluteus]